MLKLIIKIKYYKRQVLYCKITKIKMKSWMLTRDSRFFLIIYSISSFTICALSFIKVIPLRCRFPVYPFVSWGLIKQCSLQNCSSGRFTSDPCGGQFKAACEIRSVQQGKDTALLREFLFTCDCLWRFRAWCTPQNCKNKLCHSYLSKQRVRDKQSP